MLLTLGANVDKDCWCLWKLIVLVKVIGHFLWFLTILFGGLSDEDLEIELVEEEPPFLRGHTKQSMDMSPIKIVKVRRAGTLTWDGRGSSAQCAGLFSRAGYGACVGGTRATGGGVHCWSGPGTSLFSRDTDFVVFGFLITFLSF